MTEQTNGGAGASGGGGGGGDAPTLLEVKEVYEAFMFLWNKLPRSLKPEKENHQRMVRVREHFEQQLAAAKKRMLVAAQGEGIPGAEIEEGEEAEDAGSPLHVARRILRLLTRRQWEQVKFLMDLNARFEPDEVLEIVDEIADSHCGDCGAWLDDDDAHDDCPAAPDGAPDGAHDGAADGGSDAPSAPHADAQSPAPVAPQARASDPQSQQEIPTPTA